MQMMILKHIKCNDYISWIDMKNFQKTLDQFWSFKNYLHRTSKVITSFESTISTFKCW